MKLIFTLCMFLASFFELFSDDYNFIYENTSLVTMYGVGLTNPIYCVNLDGSIITVANGTAKTTYFAKIYRNGILSWYKQLGVYDEFNPAGEERTFHISNIQIYTPSTNSNFYSGFERSKSVKDRENFFWFYCSSRDINNFYSDTTLNKLAPYGSTISFFNSDERLFNMFHLRYEFSLDTNKPYPYKYYLIKNSNLKSILTKSILLDTTSSYPVSTRIITYHKKDKIVNYLNMFYKDNKDSNLYINIDKFNSDLQNISSKSLVIKTPKRINIQSFAQIDKNENDNITLSVCLNTKGTEYFILNLDCTSLMHDYHFLNFDSSFTITGYERDRNGNWLIAGTKYIYENSGYKFWFSIYKYSSDFELISSKTWGLGPNYNYLTGFAKYQEDEFIINGYYYDAENYTYNYNARFNTSTTAVEDMPSENTLKFVSLGNQVSIESESDDFKINVTNILGQEVFTQKSNSKNFTIDFENFQSGFYVITASDNNFTKSYKFIR